MYISINWIKDFVNLDGIDIDELAYKFTMATAEVEDVIHIGQDIQNVVVGKVVSMEPVEGSNKLSHVMVDIGEKDPVSCVCGAPNVRVGVIAPFAKVGGSIKKIPEIKSTILKGYESNGILCAGDEIGINDDHSGILELPSGFPVGKNLKELIEIDDVLIEVDNKSLTNRPDLWGHYGIAREIAAITGRKLKPLKLANFESYSNLPKIDITICDTEKCHRYSSITLDNVTKKVSPINMQTRLFYCGMRGISLLVDLTNYLMLEVGQPMHAFDKNMVNKIVVKSTTRETDFTTLDGVTRKVPKNTLMICNDEKPTAIAGVMGGENSEVTEATTSILLESANFDAFSIRKAATNMGMRTEAATRYEKSLDNELTVLALRRFVYLLQSIDDGATVSSCLTDVIGKEQPKISIEISKEYIDKYIGQTLSSKQIAKILTSLEFEVEYKDDVFYIKVPSWRASKDISIKPDIVEEISRIYGFDNISPKPANIMLEPLHINMMRNMEHKIQDLLAIKYGFNEVHSHVWFDMELNKKLGLHKLATTKGLTIVNPSAPENATLRTSMAPSLLYFANENQKELDEFRIFEIGSVFNLLPKKDKKTRKIHEEHKELGILFASKQISENDLFYFAKECIQDIFKATKNASPEFEAFDATIDVGDMPDEWMHPIKSAKICVNNEPCGYITVVHPFIRNNIDKKLNMVIVTLNTFKLNSLPKTEVYFKPSSKYPVTSFDLNLVMDKSVKYADVVKTIKNFKNDFIKNFEFVELYEGDKIIGTQKSMVFRFTVGSDERTLSNEDIETTRNNLIEHLEKYNLTLR